MLPQLRVVVDCCHLFTFAGQQSTNQSTKNNFENCNEICRLQFIYMILNKKPPKGGLISILAINIFDAVKH